MKKTPLASGFLMGLTFAMFAIGCATNTQTKANLAVAAGFKVITLTRPDQQAILAKLPRDKVTPVNYKGRTYYVLPRATNNQAYVGDRNEYDTYRRLRSANQLSNNNIQAAQMDPNTAMAFGTWQHAMR